MVMGDSKPTGTFNKLMSDLGKKLHINTDLMRRMKLGGGFSHRGQRNIYEVLGYDRSPNIDTYSEKFGRQDIANRIVKAYPEATWREGPEIVEDSDTDNETEFETEWINLNKRLNVFHYLMRLDILQSLGRYGVLLIGAKDVQSESDLSFQMSGLNGPEDILFLMPFSEKNADIISYDTDIMSERFGMPFHYKLDIGGSVDHSSSSIPSKTLRVHHSRVLHVAEGLLQNDIFGVPCLQPVLNRLDDLEKVVGGSAEIFWLNARGGMHLNADKDVEIKDKEKLAKEIEEYTHNFTRWIRTKGMDLNSIELTVPDPTGIVSVLLDVISGAKGIPKRILIGSERAKLASSQDENNWLNRVQERRLNFAEPIMIRPFIDKLLKAGALPSVKEYKVEWPTINTISEKDKAEIGLKKAQALSNYVSPAGTPAELIVPPKQFNEEFLGIEYLEDDIAVLEKEFDELDEDVEGENVPPASP